MNKILVVDDELSIRESFSLILGEKYKVLFAASGEGALKTVTDQKVDLVLLDIRMPGLDGLETLKRLKEIDPSLDVIMVTAVNDVRKASEAIQLGARDYLIKPFDVNAVLKIVSTLLLRKSLAGDIGKETAGLVGQSDKINAIREAIKKISAKDSSVLIWGEPGTEKETVAALLHTNSSRNKLPFLSFNLSAKMSPTEIKIKLLGKGKGTTTIDLQKIEGLFEEARGGTVFLDNVEYLPMELMGNLSVRLVGGSATPINSIETHIYLPPLRERSSDLPLLTKYFLEKLGEKYGKEIKDPSSEVMDIFSNYAWPGNVAELKTLLERLMITLPTDRIVKEDLPFDMLLKISAAPGGEFLSAFEKEFTAAGRTCLPAGKLEPA